MKARILELSHRHQIGHLSSNLTTAEILEEVRGEKCEVRSAEPLIVLSSGHAGLALYCHIEKYYSRFAGDNMFNAEMLLKKHGTQPHLDPAHGIHCTTGSLGQGITVAVGYALADRKRMVHCIISDGECAEGCVWESLAFARLHHLQNLRVHVNLNGYSALAAVDVDYLAKRLFAFLPWIEIHRTDGNQLPFLHGLHAHYKTMSEAEYLSTLDSQPSTPS